MDPLPLLDELRAMAQTGLHYADDPHDRRRYERILELTCEYYGETFDLPPEYPHHSILFLYTCRVVGGEATTTHEADEVRYRSFESVSEWAAPDYHPELARDVLAATRE